MRSPGLTNVRSNHRMDYFPSNLNGTSASDVHYITALSLQAASECRQPLEKAVAANNKVVWHLKHSQLRSGDHWSMAISMCSNGGVERPKARLGYARLAVGWRWIIGKAEAHFNRLHSPPSSTTIDALKSNVRGWGGEESGRMIGLNWYG